MRYRNKTTGVVIDVQSELKGNWERVEDAEKAPSTVKGTKKAGESNGRTVRNNRGRK